MHWGFERLGRIFTGKLVRMAVQAEIRWANVAGKHKLYSEKSNSPAIQWTLVRMGGGQWGENLKGVEGTKLGQWLKNLTQQWGSKSTWERGEQKEGKQVINLVLPYEYVPFLDAYLQKKGPRFERCCSLTQHRCCIWLKAGLPKCYPWSCGREHEDQSFRRSLEQHFLHVGCRAVLPWDINRSSLRELEKVKYSSVMLSKPSNYYCFN